MRICEVKLREVINLCNCRKLGYISDLEVDLCSGRIVAIIVPKPGGMFGLWGGENYYLIPYECIKKIGEDLVFVEICEEDCVAPFK